MACWLYLIPGYQIWLFFSGLPIIPFACSSETVMEERRKHQRVKAALLQNQQVIITLKGLDINISMILTKNV